MSVETQSQLETVQVLNGELLDVLAELVEYERTNGADRAEPELAVVNGDERIAFMTLPDNVREDETVSETIGAGRLVTNGQVTDAITIDDRVVEVEVM